MRPVVMVLGGNIYSVPSVQTLRDNGFKVVVADGSPSAPAFAVADVCGKFDFRDWEKGAALARREGVRGVIATHDRAVIPSALISRELGLLGPSPASAELATSKKKMRHAWLAAGLPSPRIELVSSVDAFKSAVAKTGFPCICKPTDDVGGGSRGVMRLDAATDLAEAYRFATSFSGSPEALVEPFFDGLEHSVEVLMKDGHGVALMISDKIKTQFPYRVDKSVIYPSTLEGGALERAKTTAIEAARALGLRDGAAHVELCTLQNTETMLFEIGLRCGGGATPHPIASLTSGVNEMVEYAHILCGTPGRDFRPTQSKGAVFHFITSRPGALKEIKGFEKARAMPGIIESALTAKPGDTVRELKTSGDRLGYFVAEGETAVEAHRRALAAERELEFIYEE